MSRRESRRSAKPQTHWAWRASVTSCTHSPHPPHRLQCHDCRVAWSWSSTGAQCEVGCAQSTASPQHGRLVGFTSGHARRGCRCAGSSAGNAACSTRGCGMPALWHILRPLHRLSRVRCKFTDECVALTRSTGPIVWRCARAPRCRRVLTRTVRGVLTHESHGGQPIGRSTTCVKRARCLPLVRWVYRPRASTSHVRLLCCASSVRSVPSLCAQPTVLYTMCEQGWQL